MANNRTGKVDAWINIRANEEGLRKQLLVVLEDAQEIVDGNVATIKFKVDESGAIQIRDKISELNKESAGGIVFGFDKAAWESMWNMLSADGKVEAENLKKILENVFSSFDFFKGFSNAYDNPFESLFDHLYYLNKLVKETKKEIRSTVKTDISKAFADFDLKPTEKSASALLGTLQAIKEKFPDMHKALGSANLSYEANGQSNIINDDLIGKFTKDAANILSKGRTDIVDKLYRYERNELDIVLGQLKSQYDDLKNNLKLRIEELSKEKIKVGKAQEEASKSEEDKIKEDSLNKLKNWTFDGTKKSINQLNKLLEKAGINIENLLFHFGKLEEIDLSKATLKPESIAEAFESLLNDDGSYGSLGTGTYAISNLAATKQDESHFVGGSKQFFAIDPSKYKLFETKTNTMATNLYDMLNTIEKLALSATNFRGFDNELEGIDAKAIFEKYQNVCSAIGLDLETLQSFINEMQEKYKNNKVEISLDEDGIPNLANWENIDDQMWKEDRISSALMKRLGWQGINNTGTSLDGLYHGSVIFDIDKADAYLIKLGKINDAILIYLELMKKRGLTPSDHFDQEYIESQRKKQQSILENANMTLGERSDGGAQVQGDISSPTQPTKVKVEVDKTELEQLPQEKKEIENQIEANPIVINTEVKSNEPQTPKVSNTSPGSPPNVPPGSNPVEIPVKYISNYEEIQKEINNLKETPPIEITVKYISNYEEISKEIATLRETDPIDVTVQLKNTKENNGTDGAEDKATSLLDSIKGISPAFESATQNVIENSAKQITSIKEISKNVNVLVENLKNIGVLSIKDLGDVVKETLKARKEAESLLKEQANRRAAEEREEAARIKKNNTEIDNALKQARLNKSQEKDNQVEYNADEQNEIRELFREAASKTDDIKIDLDSIAVSKNGLITFNEIVEETGNKATIAKHQVNDYLEAIDQEGKLNLDYLKDSSKKVAAKNLTDKALKTKFAELAKESNLAIDEGSLKVSDGIISYTTTLNRVLEDGTQKVEIYKNQVKDLNNVLNEDGQLKADFVKSSNTGTIGISVDELTKISGQVSKLEDVIKKVRTLESRGDSAPDENSEVYQKLNALKQQEVQLENEIYAALEKEKVSAQEIEKIYKRIQTARNGSLDVYEVPESILNKQRDLYTKNIEKLDYDNLLLDKTIQTESSDGSILTTTLGSQVDKIIAKIKEYYNTLTSGAVTSADEVRDLTAKINDQYAALTKLTSGENLKENQRGVLNTIFGVDSSLDKIDTKKLESMVEKFYKSQGYSQVNLGEYKNKTQSFDVELIKDGRITKAIAHLNDLQAELGETGISLRTLKKSEGEYLTFGQQWVRGIKTKMAQLTQYVTGIELVMKAWNEAKEGFNFVKELDTSMTTIYQTMDITKEGLEELSSGAIEAAKNLGAVADQMVDSVNIYAAYGKTVDEILNQASPTVMLANAIQGDAETASDYIQGVSYSPYVW